MTEQDITPAKPINEIEYFTEILRGIAHNQEILSQKLDALEESIDIIADVCICTLGIDGLVSEEGDDNDGKITG